MVKALVLVIEFISARYDGGEVGTISLAGYSGAIPEVSSTFTLILSVMVDTRANCA